MVAAIGVIIFAIGYLLSIVNKPSYLDLYTGVYSRGNMLAGLLLLVGSVFITISLVILCWRYLP